MLFYRSYWSFLKSQNTRIVKLPPPQIYLLSVTQRKFFKKFLQGQTTLMSPWRRWYINSTRGRKLLRGQNFGGRALACALSWRPQLLDGTSGGCPPSQAGPIQAGQLRPANSGPSQFRPGHPNSGRCQFRPVPIQARPSQFRPVPFQAR